MQAADEASLDALLLLNNAHAADLSLLSKARLRELIEASFVAWQLPIARALLLAMDPHSSYDGAHYLWFRARYERFVYVDRIVVKDEERGKGVARSMYRALFASAHAAGHRRVACEVNSAPPNPASDAFHAALGFVSVGTGAVAGSARRVTYFVREL